MVVRALANSVPFSLPTPALITVVTPFMCNDFFHTQWCSALGMIAVQWPKFICICFSQPCSLTWHSLLDPLVTQPAWSMLSYSTCPTLIHHIHRDVILHQQMSLWPRAATLIGTGNHSQHRSFGHPPFFWTNWVNGNMPPKTKEEDISGLPVPQCLHLMVSALVVVITFSPMQVLEK